MFVHGAISFPGAVVRIIAQLTAGIVAYPLLCVRRVYESSGCRVITALCACIHVFIPDLACPPPERRTHVRMKLSPSYVGVGGPGLQDGVSTTTGALAVRLSRPIAVLSQ